MAQDLEKLVVQLSADVKKYENALNKALGTTNKQMNAIEKRVRSSSKNISSGLAGIGKVAVGAFAGGTIIQGAVKLSDAATRIDNSLKVAGLSGEKLEEVYGRLRDSAVKNAAPLETLVKLYGQASLVQKELGVSSEQLLTFTDKVALALRVGGKSAAESSGALLQLSQALGSGVVRAEEFNSIIEGAPTILQAAAAGIKEAEGSVSKLRQIMLAGGLSSKALFDGFIVGAPMLAEKVKDVDVTFSQAMENFQTALIDTAREFNTSTGASTRFAGGINNVAKVVSDFDVSGFIGKIQSMSSEFETFLNQVGNSDVFLRLNQALGLMDDQGNVINPNVQAAKDETTALEREVTALQATIEKNTSLGFDTTEALARLAGVQAVLDQLRGQAATIPATLPNPSKGESAVIMRPTLGTKDDAFTPAASTVSINDPKYKPIATAKPKTKRTPDVKKTADDRINEDVQDIRDRTAAMAEEAAMVGKSYEAQEKRRISLDLEQHALEKLREAARRKGVTDLDGIELSDAQKASIDVSPR
jgi:tape measure domain-containing protein